MNWRRVKDLKHLEKLVNERNHVLIDVRSPDQYRYGTVMDAPNAPMRVLLPALKKCLDRTRKIILIGSEHDMESLNACLQYSVQVGPIDMKMSYFLYEDSQR